ncbi:hypothetical protein F443_10725 [Phytophthora nicotianae P1569]|uniref:Uncharacterized protein n=1 Tax=Phytophthora nicotianae P1569 TaxID=1317065 RepID=V9F0I7_PHYNI|nr:hypothetical protein F443_10725 [Phytophthora nicotianae P1569]
MSTSPCLPMMQRLQQTPGARRTASSESQCASRIGKTHGIRYLGFACMYVNAIGAMTSPCEEQVKADGCLSQDGRPRWRAALLAKCRSPLQRSRVMALLEVWKPLTVRLAPQCRSASAVDTHTAWCWSWSRVEDIWTTIG